MFLRFLWPHFVSPMLIVSVFLYIFPIIHNSSICPPQFFLRFACYINAPLSAEFDHLIHHTYCINFLRFTSLINYIAVIHLTCLFSWTIWLTTFKIRCIPSTGLTFFTNTQKHSSCQSGIPFYCKVGSNPHNISLYTCKQRVGFESIPSLTVT